MGGFTRSKAENDEQVAHVYELFPRLQERHSQKGGTLSGGEQQMLAIGRALMTRPTVLLLDEPSLGLAPILVQQIFRIIREINDRGMTILLVEQNALQALSIANRGYVLQTGEVVLLGRLEGPDGERDRPQGLPRRGLTGGGTPAVPPLVMPPDGGQPRRPVRRPDSPRPPSGVTPGATDEAAEARLAPREQARMDEAVVRVAGRGHGPTIAAALVAVAFLIGLVRPWDWLTGGPVPTPAPSPGAAMAEEGDATLSPSASAGGDPAPIVGAPTCGYPTSWRTSTIQLWAGTTGQGVDGRRGGAGVGGPSTRPSRSTSSPPTWWRPSGGVPPWTVPIVPRWPPRRPCSGWWTARRRRSPSIAWSRWPATPWASCGCRRRRRGGGDRPGPRAGTSSGWPSNRAHTCATWAWRSGCPSPGRRRRRCRNRRPRECRGHRRQLERRGHRRRRERRGHRRRRSPTHHPSGGPAPARSRRPPGRA